MSSYWETLVAGAYDRQARKHQPQTREEMRAAVVELRQRGLLPRDIAAALQISEAAVNDLLGECR